MSKCAAFAAVILALALAPFHGQFKLGVQEREWLGENGFGWHSTAQEVSDGVDLTGKVAMITGGNSGLGLETARIFALRGAHVILVARSLEKAESAIKVRTSTATTPLPPSA